MRFTTHGQRSMELIQGKKVTYGLTEEAQHKVLREFQAKGYGYADYPNQSGYGISMVSHSRIVELARGVGRWNEVSFMEHGWDDHPGRLCFRNADAKQRHGERQVTARQRTLLLEPG